MTKKKKFSKKYFSMTPPPLPPKTYLIALYTHL